MSEDQPDSPETLADLDVTEESSIATGMDETNTSPEMLGEFLNENVPGLMQALASAQPTYDEPTEPPPPPHEMIQLAQRMLGGQTEPGPSNLSAYTPSYSPEVVQQMPSNLSVFDKFPDVTAQLRDQSPDTEINLYRVMKLNLAATVETLERAVNAHESFPNADAGIAVAQLAQQVNVLTKELKKAQDPLAIYHKVVEEAMEPLTMDTVKVVVEESRWLISQFEYHVPEDKRGAFKETVKQMATRVGPSLRDSLELAKQRLLVALNLQDKKPKS